jgi:ubiquitin conjugation factor E4 B
MFPAAESAVKVLQLLRTNFHGDIPARFERLAKLLTDRTAAQEEEAIDYEDAPDEFLDALTCELMRQPMKLPSGHWMDYEWLRKALLSKPLDPFTMTPLTLEECVPDEELKKRIEEYRERKKQEKKAKDTPE